MCEISEIIYFKIIMFNNEMFYGYVKGYSDKSDINILYDVYLK